MSQPAAKVTPPTAIDRVFDLLTQCMQQQFTGPVEVHFKDGRPMFAKKIETFHLADPRRGLTVSG